MIIKFSWMKFELKIKWIFDKLDLNRSIVPSHVFVIVKNSDAYRWLSVAIKDFIESSDNYRGLDNYR